jgi:hypothetical protein
MTHECVAGAADVGRLTGRARDTLVRHSCGTVTRWSGGTCPRVVRATRSPDDGWAADGAPGGARGGDGRGAAEGKCAESGDRVTQLQQQLAVVQVCTRACNE